MNERRFPGTEREIPSPEVAKKPVRRRFAAEYKLRILAEANACTERVSLGELLRRVGLYLSHLGTWPKQREEGAIRAAGPPAAIARFPIAECRRSRR